MTSIRHLLTASLASALLAAPLCAATYYVDFDAGDDNAVGTAPETPFKHAPGDPAAANAAKTAKLTPSDTVILKGGVIYRGMISVAASGEKDKPITLDGNTAGTFGKGRAIIDGADPVTGWKRCASPDEASGNPNWKNIFYAEIPSAPDFRNVNLCDETKPLPISQDPNPADPMFQEDPKDYYMVQAPLTLVGGARVSPEPGTRTNSVRPLVLVISGLRDSAVVDPLVGGGFSIELPRQATVTSVGIAPQPNYGAPKEVVFLADGKEILKTELKKNEKNIQRFTLPAPVALTKLTVKFLSAHEGEKSTFTAVRQVSAWDAGGKDVLANPGQFTLTDPKHLTAKSADFYDGMTLGFHGGPNMIEYTKIKSFDPAAGRLILDLYAGRLYKDTRYALFNSVRLIDVPGEFSVEPTVNPKLSRVYLWPERLDNDLPAGVGAARRPRGIQTVQASNVVIQGFIVRRQGNARLVTGIGADGPAQNVTIRDCDVSLVRGNEGIGASKIDNIRVEKSSVHDNPGHTKGIVYHTCTNADIRDCTLTKNTSTALDYYICSNGTVSGNIVLDHRGMHANGLTFYLGCKNILIERNYVARGNCALTFQEADGLIFRNNILDANDRTTTVGIWNALPLKNVEFSYNAIVRSNHAEDYTVGIFTNSKSIEGLVVRNNIIDGLYNETPGVLAKATFEYNLYTRKAAYHEKHPLGKGEAFETDVKKIFVDPANDTFQLRPDGPAINAGRTFENDGTKSPTGEPINLGPYAMPPMPKR